MPSNYPQNLDRFRGWLNELDTMIGQDLNDLFDAVENIQGELGLKPSGTTGSIAARLFGNGNISQKSGLWLRLQWGGAVLDGSRFYRSSGSGYQQPFDKTIYRGSNTTWGEDVPAIFGALQGPLSSPKGATQRGGVPWKAALAEVDETRFSWVAVDGEAWSPPNNELVGNNSTSCVFGLLAWGCRT